MPELDYDAIVNARENFPKNLRDAMQYIFKVRSLIMEYGGAGDITRVRKLYAAATAAFKDFPKASFAYVSTSLDMRRCRFADDIEQTQGLYDDATVFQKELPRNQGIVECRMAAALALNVYYAGTGDLERAREFCDVLGDICRMGWAHWGGGAAYAKALCNMTAFCGEAGDIAQARKFCDALTELRNEQSHDPEVVKQHATAVRHLLLACENADGIEEARKLCAAVLDFSWGGEYAEASVRLVSRYIRVDDHERARIVRRDLAGIAKNFLNDPESAGARLHTLIVLTAYCVQAEEIGQARKLYDIVKGLRKNFPDDLHVVRAYFEATISLIKYYNGDGLTDVRDTRKMRTLCDTLAGIERFFPNDSDVAWRHLEAGSRLIWRYMEEIHVDDARQVYDDMAEIGRLFPRELSIARRRASLAETLVPPHSYDPVTTEDVELAQKYYDEIQEIRKAFPDDPDIARDYAEAACHMGFLCGAVGDLDQARTFYEVTTNIEKEFPDDTHIAGSCSEAAEALIAHCLRLGDVNRARAFYDAITNKEDCPEATVELITHYLRTNGVDRAQELYDVITDKKKYPEAINEWIAHLAGDADRVREFIAKEIADDADLAADCADKAFHHGDESDRLRKSYDVLAALQRNCPDNSKVLEGYWNTAPYLVEHYIEVNDIAQAQEIYDAMTVVGESFAEPEDGWSRFRAAARLVVYCLGTGDIDRARKIYEGMVTIRGESFGAYARATVAWIAYQGSAGDVSLPDTPCDAAEYSREAARLVTAYLWKDDVDRARTFYDAITLIRRKFPDEPDVGKQHAKAAVRFMAYHLWHDERGQARQFLEKDSRGTAVECSKAADRRIWRCFTRGMCSDDDLFDTALGFRDVLTFLREEFPNDPDIACSEARALNTLAAWCGFIGTEEYIDEMPAFYKTVTALAKQFRGDRDIRQQKVMADEIFKVDAGAIFRRGGTD